MYLTPTNKHWIVDIETDGLDPSQVWVLCAKNAVTKEERCCETYEEIRKFCEETGDCCYVFHNGIGFDVPVLNRLVGTRIALTRVVDSFILSSVYSPSISGGHSLDAWGERLGYKKQEHDEWHVYSDAMRGRCKSDVEITWQLFTRLTAKMRRLGFTERGIDIEHKAWYIIQKQRKNGFWFNYRQAHELVVELRAKERELQEKIYERFPPEEKLLAVYRRANKADGTPSKQFERHREQFKRLEVRPDGSYAAYGDVAFNIGSPPQRIEKLLALGWVPREFTPPSKTFPNGQPQPTRKGELSPSLREFADESGIEEVGLIAKWIAVNSRANTINGWMDDCDVRDSCLHGSLWLANTLRYRHDHPNTANIPRIRTKKVDGQEVILLGEEGYWTYEARDLWQTRDRVNRRLVGVDAKGIQLRVLAHYLNNDKFTQAILSVDPHEANAKAMGLPSRNVAKTIVYAITMGAGLARISSEAKISLDEAKAVQQVFFDQVPELEEFTARLRYEIKRTGRLRLISGTPILVSEPRLGIPYLLQGDESQIMKQAAIYVDEKVRRDRLDALKVGDIHDEWQVDCRTTDVAAFIEACSTGFRQAGISFNYNLPIECDAKVGYTWAETH